MKIAAVNFRGLSLWRLHPGGTRTYLIPSMLWLRASTGGNSPLQGFPLLVLSSATREHFGCAQLFPCGWSGRAPAFTAPLVLLGLSLPSAHSMPTRRNCHSSCCSTQPEAATWDLGKAWRHQAVDLSCACGCCYCVPWLGSSGCSQLVWLPAQWIINWYKWLE